MTQSPTNQSARIFIITGAISYSKSGKSSCNINLVLPLTVLHFNFFLNLVPPKISLPAVVEALPDYRVKIPVTGTPPIYTAIIRDSTVLVNTTYTAAFQFYNGSNYTSVAFNKYGYDTRDFTVISRGKEISEWNEVPKNSTHRIEPVLSSTRGLRNELNLFSSTLRFELTALCSLLHINVV